MQRVQKIKINFWNIFKSTYKLVKSEYTIWKIGAEYDKLWHRGKWLFVL